MYRLSLAALFVLLLSFGGCDSASGIEVSDPDQVFDIAPYARTLIDLSDALGIEEGVAVSFDVAAESDPVRAAIGFPDNLILTPRALGAGTVDIAVRLQGDLLSTARLRINVVDPGPGPTLAPVTLSPGASYQVDLSTLFLPSRTTTYELVSIDGPVSFSLDGSLLTVTPFGSGTATIALRTTTFVPQTLSLQFVVEGGS